MCRLPLQSLRPRLRLTPLVWWLALPCLALVGGGARGADSVRTLPHLALVASADCISSIPLPSSLAEVDNPASPCLPDGVNIGLVQPF